MLWSPFTVEINTLLPDFRRELTSSFLKLALGPLPYQPSPGQLVVHHTYTPEVGLMLREQEDLTKLPFLCFLWEPVGLFFVIQMKFVNYREHRDVLNRCRL